MLRTKDTDMNARRRAKTLNKGIDLFSQCLLKCGNGVE